VRPRTQILEGFQNFRNRVERARDLSGFNQWRGQAARVVSKSSGNGVEKNPAFRTEYMEENGTVAGSFHRPESFNWTIRKQPLELILTVETHAKNRLTKLRCSVS
jgi:hypothetical protein